MVVIMVAILSCYYGNFDYMSHIPSYLLLCDVTTMQHPLPHPWKPLQDPILQLLYHVIQYLYSYSTYFDFSSLINSIVTTNGRMLSRGANGFEHIVTLISWNMDVVLKACFSFTATHEELSIKRRPTWCPQFKHIPSPLLVQPLTLFESFHVCLV